MSKMLVNQKQDTSLAQYKLLSQTEIQSHIQRHVHTKVENSIRDYINIILEILSNAKDKKKHQATDIRKREFKIPLFIIYFLSNLQKNQLRSPRVQILVSKEQCPLKVSELPGEIANSRSGKEIHKVTLGHLVGPESKEIFQC